MPTELLLEAGERQSGPAKIADVPAESSRNLANLRNPVKTRGFAHL